MRWNWWISFHTDWAKGRTNNHFINRIISNTSHILTFNGFFSGFFFIFFFFWKAHFFIVVCCVDVVPLSLVSSSSFFSERFVKCIIIRQHDMKKSSKPQQQQQLAPILLLHFFLTRFFLSLDLCVKHTQFFYSWFGSCYTEKKTFIYLFKTMLSLSRVQDYRHFVSIFFPIIVVIIHIN